MDAVVARTEFLVHVDVPFSHARMYRIFLLPHDAVPAVRHLHEQGTAPVRKCQCLRIEGIRLEPQVFACLIYALAGLQVHRFP